MSAPASASASQAIPLCASEELQDSGAGVPFEVLYYGRAERGFAIRFQGQVYDYLNRCAHVPMEMDYQPNQFFDQSGLWLICATHGALYSPTTGQCRGGPCRGGLIPILLSESDGQVHWHTSPHLQALAF